MSSQDWYSSLAFGNHGEELARKKVRRFLTSVINYCDYDTTDGKSKQRNGIDFSVSLTDFTFDVKTRDYTYWYKKDILIETISVVENNIPGWIYTSKSDLIFYTWLNRAQTEIHDAKILIVKPLREFILEYINKTDPKLKTTQTYKDCHSYHTEFFTVPISDFPTGTILNCDISKMDEVCYLNESEMKYSSTQPEKQTVYEIHDTSNTKHTQMNLSAYGWV